MPEVTRTNDQRPSKPSQLCLSDAVQPLAEDRVRVARWIEEIHVADAIEFDEIDIVSSCDCRTCVASRDLDRQRGVRDAVYDKLLHAERQHRCRRRHPIALWPLGGRATQQFRDCVVSNRKVMGKNQIGNGRQPCNSHNVDMLLRIVHALRCIAPRAPQGEMPACGMTNDDNASEIEHYTIGRDCREMIDACTDVLKGAGPSASWCADPAIFQVPDCETARNQIARNSVHFVAAIRHSPEPAMQQADNWRAGRLWEIQVANLIACRSISNGLDRDRAVWHGLLIPNQQEQESIKLRCASYRLALSRHCRLRCRCWSHTLVFDGRPSREKNVNQATSLGLRILGTGEYVPSQQVDSCALDRRWGKQAGWTRKHSGIDHRYFADREETSSLMAARAAQAALNASGLEARDLDCVVSACSVMEQAIPCTAALIHRELGLGGSGIPAFDINATCLSFLVALDLLAMSISAGRFRRVLIVSSEVASAGLPWDEPATAMLFGDGAAAVVLSGGAAEQSSELMGTHFETYSDGANFCQIRAGGTRMRVHDDPEEYAKHAVFRMDGKATYRMAAQRLPVYLQRLFARAGVELSDLAAIVPHQASAKALTHLQTALGLPEEQIVRVLPTRANQMAASIPVALHHAVSSGRVRRGDTIALVGSGAGLSFGGAVLRY
jgi:3-oxoacyl-[acyl-carrier-protein] synthase-3